MKIPWYKSELKQLYKLLDKNNKLCGLWSKNFSFQVQIPEMNSYFQNVAIVMGTLKRLEETAKLWSDHNTMSAVSVSILVCSLYICIVYPREKFLLDLNRRLSENYPEKKLLDFLTSKNSVTRLIRNSLSHGTYEIRSDSIIFKDEYMGRQEEFTFIELRIIVLLVLDIFMSCYKKKSHKNRSLFRRDSDMSK